MSIFPAAGPEKLPHVIAVDVSNVLIVALAITASVASANGVVSF